MNQTCKVCGEPAAGFHFGAFTCEGCKSFFGRSYNNLASISECKNNSECVINKKNRTACKACRLRKCILVGMSKSGSRYGRRSNWFKIHCLLQEQQQQAVAAATQGNRKTPPQAISMFGHPSYSSGMPCRPPCTKEELMLLGFEDYKLQPSSSVSSPDSHKSDSSVEVGDRRNSLIRQNMSRDQLAYNKELFMQVMPMPFPSIPSMMPPPGMAAVPGLLPPHMIFPGYHSLYAQHQGLLKPAFDPPLSAIANNNNRLVPNHNSNSEESKRFFLDAVLKKQRSPTNITIKSEEEEEDGEDLVVSMTPSPVTTPQSPPSRTAVQSQDNPIDLSMKTNSSTSDDVRTMSGGESDISDDEHEQKHIPSHSDLEDGYARDIKRIKVNGKPLDLTRKV